jgi:hypothetical protein
MVQDSTEVPVTKERMEKRIRQGLNDFGDDLRNMNPEIAWATLLSMGWKSKLEFWPYVAVAVSLLGLLYLIVTSNH